MKCFLGDCLFRSVQAKSIFLVVTAIVATVFFYSLTFPSIPYLPLPFPLLVVVAFSSRARILGKCSTIHSPTSPFFTWHAHTHSTLYARISPQWLNELRRL